MIKPYPFLWMLCYLTLTACQQKHEQDAPLVNKGSTLQVMNRRAVWILHAQDYRSTEKILTNIELQAFLDTIKTRPDEFYAKAIFRDSVPILENPNYQPTTYLSLRDYYRLFQSSYWYAYHGPHPFYIISYKIYGGYTRFFIHHRNDYSQMVFMIHMSPNGKTFFHDPIWAEGGDGGDYHRITFSTLTESALELTSVMGFYAENEKEKNEEHAIKVYIEFDKNGRVKSRKETILKK